MPKGKKKKASKDNEIKVDIQIAVLFIISILLAVLIYTKSGFIGQNLNTVLGGLISVCQYVLPIGIFLIAIYLIKNKKDGLRGKIYQYLALIICICVFLSVHQYSTGTFEGADFNGIVEDSYSLGTTNIGGGVIGTLLATLLVNLIGIPGGYIVTVGAFIVLAIFISGIRPTEIIREKLEERAEREKIMYQQKADLKQVKETKQEKRAKKKRVIDFDLGEDQIQINMDNIGEENKTNEKEKAGFVEANLFKKSSKEIVDEPVKSEPKVDDLFIEKEKVKEDSTEQVLTIDHTTTSEDEQYEYPPINLLTPAGAKKGTGKKALTETASKLQKTLYSFGVSAKVENVSVGPAITRYELKPAEGVRVSKIAKLADDIALNLAAESIRIEAPIPGKQAVGIEIPNKEKEAVALREIIDTPEFSEAKSKTSIALGKDVAGSVVVADIAKMPHVLIAGSTGSGKSVCINTLITSIVYKAKPSEVKLLMIDPKVVELSVYNGIPHLLIPVVTDPRKASGALQWAVQEMISRYGLFAQKGVRDIEGYNKTIENAGEKMPHIVIIVDELADLMMASPKEVEDSICRLAQMARAAGMHLVIATQRPSVDVITGVIKANIPSRISFAVSSGVDSRTILDMYGAEKLLGKGDMLFFPIGAAKPVRIQGAFISDTEVEKIVDFLKAGKETTYNEDIIEKIEKANKSDKEISEDEEDDADEFLMDAIETVVETGQASTSFIQRRFKVGYARAGRIIDQMEARGVISGYEGSKPRQVLMTKERLEELKMSSKK